MSQDQQPLLKVTDLTREFPAGESTIQILKGINLEIYPGELVAIVGQSGSGKSTLMNILGCLDQPTSGSYQVKGRETRQLEADELAQLRREYFGFIFQRYHLLGDLSAAANVEVPAIYAGVDASARQQRSTQLLSDLGLAEKTQNRPSQLSGGQQQRVSIARALMNGGDVILADEPTGALDKNSGIEVMRILRELNAKGHTIILCTEKNIFLALCGGPARRSLSYGTAGDECAPHAYLPDHARDHYRDCIGGICSRTGQWFTKKNSGKYQ